MSNSGKYAHIKHASTGTFESDAPLEEGKIQRLPFTTSPFEKINESIHSEQDRQRMLSRELEVKVANEVPWSDLLLEISMTTAFASLTDGTTISDAPSVVSYVSFFALVWWIWASQVAYNMRFRQADIIHRVFVFCQLLVFAALAAFTDNFDITQLTPPNQTQPHFENKSEFLASQHRSKGVSTADNRGISLVMALSRLLLLIQYAVVFYYAKTLRRRAIGVHIAALSISTLCFFIAYGILHGEPAEGKEIAKLVLWYFPVALELLSHYAASLLQGHVAYPAEIVSQRSATLFIIVLGGGLDKITSGLRILVGNGGIKSAPWGLLTCSALVFICQFSLYFNSPADSHLRSLRSLTWFFSHFFYLAALIVTLQGIASQLTFGRLGEGFTQVNTALDPMRQFIVDNPGVNLTTSTSAWPDASKLYLTNGWSLNDDIQGINSYIYWGVQINSSIAGVNGWAQFWMNDLWSEMDLFDVDPSNTLLKQMYWFVYLADPSNSTQINTTTTGLVTNSLWKDQATPSTWFFAAAGSTLLALAFINMIGRWPKDKWYWGLWISRIVSGVTLILLTTIDVGVSQPEYNSDDQFTPTLFWSLVDKYLILVIVAVILVTEQIVEMVLIYFAGNLSSSLVRRPSISRLMQRRSSSQNTIYHLGPMREEPFDAAVLYDSPLPLHSKKASNDYISAKDEKPENITQ